MAQCKTAVTPLLTHWSYCSLALSPRNVLTKLQSYITTEAVKYFPCQNHSILSNNFEITNYNCWLTYWPITQISKGPWEQCRHNIFTKNKVSWIKKFIYFYNIKICMMTGSPGFSHRFSVVFWGRNSIIWDAEEVCGMFLHVPEKKKENMFIHYFPV